MQKGAIRTEWKLIRSACGGGWSASGFTPGAKRANPTGMFENIGSALICCESKLAPDDTDVVSSTGAVPVTVTCSLILPTSSVNGRLVCCPTANATLSRVAVLKPAISTTIRYVPGCNSGASK